MDWQVPLLHLLAPGSTELAAQLRIGANLCCLQQCFVTNFQRSPEIENFSGRSLLAIRQDSHAKILAMNLATMVRNVAQRA